MILEDPRRQKETQYETERFNIYHKYMYGFWKICITSIRRLANQSDLFKPYPKFNQLEI